MKECPTKSQLLHSLATTLRALAEIGHLVWVLATWFLFSLGVMDDCFHSTTFRDTHVKFLCIIFNNEQKKTEFQALPIRSTTTYY